MRLGKCFIEVSRWTYNLKVASIVTNEKSNGDLLLELELNDDDVKVMRQDNLELKNKKPCDLEQVEVITTFLRYCMHRHIKDIAKHMEHEANPHIYNVFGIFEITRPSGNKPVK